jgi:hypothetical protein
MSTPARTLSGFRKLLPLVLAAIIFTGAFPLISFAADPPATAPDAGAPADKTAQLDAAFAKKQVDTSRQLTNAVEHPVAAVKDAALGAAADTIMAALAGLAWMMLRLAGSLLGMVGALFNWIIVITVFQYGAYFGNSQGMLIAWGILRDIGNIVLLFGFILISVMVILDIHGFDAKRALPRFIIFAVLLNFSLFASEAVVDVANGLSATLYKQAGTAALGADSCISANTNDNACLNVGIASTIINDTYLGTALNPDSTKTSVEKLNSDDGRRFIAYIGISIFIMIVMVLLLAAAIIFLVRAVMLTILLVLSPVAFAAMAIPQFQSQANEWWNKLLSNAFFAPIFLLLLFVGLKVMESARTALGGSSANLASAMSNPDVSMGGILIIFGLTIGFMIAALQVAKGSGAAGATFATGFATKTVRGIVTAPARAAAGAGRGLGGVAYRKGIAAPVTSLSHKYDAWMGKKDKGALGAAVSKTLRATGADEALHGTAHKIAAVKPLGTRSHEEEIKYQKERTGHISHAAEMEHLKTDVDAGLKDGAAATEKDKAERALQKMSDDDIAKTITNMKDAKSLSTLSKVLSTEKFGKAMENKEINADKKEELLEERYREIDETFQKYKAGTATFAELKTATDKSEKDLELMARYLPNTFDAIAAEIDPVNREGVFRASVADSLGKKESLTSSQRKLLNDSKRSEQLKRAVDGDDVPAVAILASKMGKDMGKVPESKFTAGTTASRALIDSLDSTKMAALMSEGEMSQGGKDTILDHIRAKGPADAQYIKINAYLKGNAAGWWGTL